MTEANFVEFSERETNSPIVINRNFIVGIEKTTESIVIFTTNRTYEVAQEFEEVKKRIGMTITPRGDTIMAIAS